MRRRIAAAVLVVAAAAGASSAAAGPGADRDVRALAEAIRTNHPDPYHSVSPRRLRRRGRRARGARAGAARRRGARRAHAHHRPARRARRPRGHPSAPHRPPEPDAPAAAEAPPLLRTATGSWPRSASLGLVGKRLVAIEGIPVEQVAERARPLVTRDNESTVRARLPEYVLVTEVLHGLGLVPDAGPRRLTFADAAGAAAGRRARAGGVPEYVAALAPQFGGFVYGLPRRAKPLYLAKKHLAALPDHAGRRAHGLPRLQHDDGLHGHAGRPAACASPRSRRRGAS